MNIKTIRQIYRIPWVIFGALRELFLRPFILNKLKDGDYFLKYDIPLYTQRISSELTDDIVNNKIRTKDDPRWMESGAKDPAEYESYSWQICGMACLKMILKSVYPDQEHKLVELAKEAENHKVYVKNNNSDYRHNLDGMFHGPFIKFIKKFGLKGFRHIRVDKNYLATLIKKNNFVIASVHKSVRGEPLPDNSKQGHLVLVVGFKIKNNKVQGFYINNPSGYYNKSQARHFVSMDNWRKCFSGNVIAIER